MDHHVGDSGEVTHIASPGAPFSSKFDKYMLCIICICIWPLGTKLSGDLFGYIRSDSILRFVQFVGLSLMSDTKDQMNGAIVVLVIYSGRLSFYRSHLLRSFIAPTCLIVMMLLANDSKNFIVHHIVCSNIYM